ncbi:MAG: hypothetical protein ACYCS1_08410 [Gammaproteobacteria bacterium]
MIKPSVRQTAAWLSIWDADVAREVSEREPMLLLMEGDPGSLLPSVRGNVLNRIVEQMRQSGERGGLIKDDALRRFSVPELAPLVRDLWNKHRAIQPVRELLVRIIGLGRLTACADIAEEAVFGGYKDIYTLVFGARALAAFADPVVVARYHDYIVANAKVLPERALWEALDQLFLRGMSIAQFLAILGDMMPDVRDGSLGLQHLGPLFAERIDVPSQLEEFLTGLMSLLGEGSHDVGAMETPAEKSYFPVITATAHRLLSRVAPTSAPRIAVAAALRLAEDRHHRTGDEHRDLLQDLKTTPSRRRAAFWQAADHLRDHPMLQGKKLESPWQMQILGFSPGLETADLDWLLADATDAALCDSDDRKQLVSNAVMEIWKQFDQPDALLTRIRTVMDEDAVMADVVTTWLKPKVPSDWEVEHQERMAAMDAERNRREKEQSDSWNEFLDSLRNNPDQLRHIPAPTRDNVDGRLFSLWELLHSMDERQSRYAIDDAHVVEPILGHDLTLAFRDGLIAFWRQWEPTFEASRPTDKRNQVSKINCMAIAGISMEARTDPQWIDRLSSAEAARAAAFGTLELNGFPPWMSPLAEKNGRTKSAMSWRGKSSSRLMIRHRACIAARCKTCITQKPQLPRSLRRLSCPDWKSGRVLKERSWHPF